MGIQRRGLLSGCYSAILKVLLAMACLLGLSGRSSLRGRCRGLITPSMAPRIAPVVMPEAAENGSFGAWRAIAISGSDWMRNAGYTLPTAKRPGGRAVRQVPLRPQRRGFCADPLGCGSEPVRPSQDRVSARRRPLAAQVHAVPQPGEHRASGSPEHPDEGFKADLPGAEPRLRFVPQGPAPGPGGAACERCHVVEAWKDIGKFNHAATKYPLTGAHERTACQKCHMTIPAQDGGKAHVRYVGIPFAQCAPCHQDPHHGAFAAVCSSCHNDVAWKPAHNTSAAFDHSKTKFSLLGKHAPVACDKCHKTSDYKAAIPHELCGDCHKDIHGGQFLTTKAARIARDATQPTVGKARHTRWRRTPRAAIP